MKSALFLALLALFAMPAFADGESEPAPQDAVTAESVAGIEKAPELAETQIVDTSELELLVDFELLRLLGVSSPLDTQAFVGPGYCYHDCSPCFSREDCQEPGFPFGFPCTQIRLC